MVCYSHLLKNFPQFVVIHTVKGFLVVNKAEVDVCLEFSCFFYNPTDVGNLISGSTAFSKSNLYVSKLSVHIMMKIGLKDFEHYLASLCCTMLSHFSCFQVFVTLWTLPHQSSLSMGFSRQEYWSGFLHPSPGDLHDPGTKPKSCMFSALAGRFFTTSATWEVLLAYEIITIVQWFEHSLPLPFFGIGMKIDHFQSCGHC